MSTSPDSSAANTCHPPILDPALRVKLEKECEQDLKDILNPISWKKILDFLKKRTTAELITVQLIGEKMGMHKSDDEDFYHRRLFVVNYPDYEYELNNEYIKPISRDTDLCKLVEKRCVKIFPNAKKEYEGKLPPKVISWICMPLVHKCEKSDTLVGLITFDKTKQSQFIDEDQSLTARLQPIADFLAEKIDTAFREKEDKLTHEIMSVLSGVQGEDQTVQIIADRIRNALNKMGMAEMRHPIKHCTFFRPEPNAYHPTFLKFWANEEGLEPPLFSRSIWAKNKGAAGQSLACTSEKIEERRKKAVSAGEQQKTESGKAEAENPFKTCIQLQYDAQKEEASKTPNTHAVFAVPVILSRENDPFIKQVNTSPKVESCLAVLAVNSEAAGAFCRYDADLVFAVVNRLAPNIERARVLELIHKASRACVASQNLYEALNTIAAYAAKLAESTVAFVPILKDDECIKFVGVYPPDARKDIDALKPFSLSDNPGYTGFVIRDSQYIHWVDDICPKKAHQGTNNPGTEDINANRANDDVKKDIFYPQPIAFTYCEKNKKQPIPICSELYIPIPNLDTTRKNNYAAGVLIVGFAEQDKPGEENKPDTTESASEMTTDGTAATTFQAAEVKGGEALKTAEQPISAETVAAEPGQDEAPKLADEPRAEQSTDSRKAGINDGDTFNSAIVDGLKRLADIAAEAILRFRQPRHSLGLDQSVTSHARYECDIFLALAFDDENKRNWVHKLVQQAANDAFKDLSPKTTCANCTCKPDNPPVTCKEESGDNEAGSSPDSNEKKDKCVQDFETKQTDEKICCAGKKVRIANVRVLISREVWSYIVHCELFIGDITPKKNRIVSPNVYYEIGLACALNKPVILVGQEGEIPEPDLGSSLFRVSYDYDEERISETKALSRTNKNFVKILARKIREKYDELYQSGGQVN